MASSIASPTSRRCAIPAQGQVHASLRPWGGGAGPVRMAYARRHAAPRASSLTLALVCVRRPQVGDFQTELGDGWGLTTDGTHLIATESSPTVHFIDPATFKTVRKFTVMDQGTPIKWVNEVSPLPCGCAWRMLVARPPRTSDG